MSDIAKVKEAGQSLEFLNGEIVKRTKVKEDLEIEIATLASTHKKSSEQLDAAIGNKSITLENLEKTIPVKQKELTTLETKIAEKTIESQSVGGTLEARKKALDEREAGLNAKAEENKIADAQNATRKAELDEKERLITIGYQTLAEGEKRLNLGIEKLNLDADKLTKRETEIVSRETSAKKKEEDATALFSQNATRANEIEEGARKLDIEKRSFEVERNDMQYREREVIAGEIKNAETLKTIATKQSELDTRVTTIAKREQLSILKEEELKVREKRISIAENAKNL